MKTSSLILIFDIVTRKPIGGTSTLLDSSSVPILSNFKKRSQQILSEPHFYKDQQFNLDLWPCDLNINRNHLLSRVEEFTVPSLATFQHRGQETLSGEHFFKDQQFDHDLWPCDLQIGDINSLGASTVVWKLSNKGVQKASFVQRPAYDFNLWPCDLKINRDFLISKAIQCIKSGNFQAKGSKDIEWTSLGLQINRSTD